MYTYVRYIFFIFFRREHVYLKMELQTLSSPLHKKVKSIYTVPLFYFVQNKKKIISIDVLNFCVRYLPDIIYTCTCTYSILFSIAFYNVHIKMAVQIYFWLITGILLLLTVHGKVMLHESPVYTTK